MRVVKQPLAFVVSAAALLLVSGRAVAQAQPSFPEPTGPFEVGRLVIDVTDSSRDEVFTDEPADKRRLLVTVYYPANVPAGAEHDTYGTPELAAVWPFFTPERRAWRSVGYAGVPVAEGRFPVLLFSPGFGSLTLYYSSLLHEIASRGFVIAALWHPYSAEVVAFPDGTVLRMSPAGNLNGVPFDEQAARLEQLGLVWAGDQRFVLDQLAARNTQHALLAGHLDLERVGTFGHSLGGASSVQAAQVDLRIDAAINMDGAMFGAATREGSRVPFLFIQAERPVLTDAELQQAGITRERFDTVIASIIDTRNTMFARSRTARTEKLELSKHNTFMTDFLFLTGTGPPARRTALIGDVEPTAAFTAVSSWIADFMTEHVAQTAE